MITLQRFIDFLTIYSLYFYKNSRRARGCSFYFNFTIKDISTCSPELLLLCFCGLHSIYFLKKKKFALSAFHLLPCSMNFAHIHCLCPGFTLSRVLFWCSSFTYSNVLGHLIPRLPCPSLISLFLCSMDFPDNAGNIFCLFPSTFYRIQVVATVLNIFFWSWNNMLSICKGCKIFFSNVLNGYICKMCHIIKTIMFAITNNTKHLWN